jgi:transcriptional regulator with XRE-family HTH domain
MAFGEWLLAARGKMTQHVLADKAGVSKGYITSIEKNRKVPSIEVAVALAQALGRPTEEALAALAGQDSPAVKKAGKRRKIARAVLTDPKTLEEDELTALYFRHKKLSPKKRAEFRRILEMVDRELDRLEREDRANGK